MTVFYSVDADDVALPEDVNQYKKMLEGSSGYTSTYSLKSTSGTDFSITLGDAAGARKLSIKDSAGVEVWAVNSDGAITAGALTPTSLVLPASAAPSQTAVGNIVWDSVLNYITVGNGSSRTVFRTGYRILKYNTATQTVSASTTFVDVVGAGSPATFTFPVLANEVWRVKYFIPMTFTNVGGAKFQLTGPAAPTAVAIISQPWLYNATSAAAAGIPKMQAPVTSFSSTFGAFAAAATTDNTYTSSSATTMLVAEAVIQNGATAGDVTLQIAQNTAAGTVVVGLGSYMEAEKMS